MPAFRLFPPLQTFFGSQGELLRGGELRFYEAGTTTPLDVYGDPGLTTNNGSTVELDSSGRPNVDVWGEASYFVELYDADGVKQGEADAVQVPGGSGTTLPTLEPDEFLTSDGTTMSWQPVRQLPDPTGQSGKVLSTDGTVYVWITKPADGTPGADAGNVESDGTTMRIGDFLMQTGSGSAAATNADTASVAVVFPVPFTTPPVHIGVTVKDITTATGHALVAHSVTNVTTNGFTLNFNVADRHYHDGSKIVAAIPFTYAAFGVKAL